MPRPRNMTAVLSLQKRWSRLANLVKRLQAEMTKPTKTTSRRSNVVVCGRIINNIVCTFAVPDQITTMVLNDLNGSLMRMETHEDILKVSTLELTVLHDLKIFMNSKIADLSKEIEASKVFPK